MSAETAPAPLGEAGPGYERTSLAVGAVVDPTATIRQPGVNVRDGRRLSLSRNPETAALELVEQIGGRELALNFVSSLLPAVALVDRVHG